MKKIFLVVLIIVCLITVKEVFAATVIISNAEGAPGDSNIPVIISAKAIEVNTGLSGIDLWLEYDKNLLSVEKVELGKITSAASLSFNPKEAGLVKIAIFSTTPILQREGELAKIFFSVNEKAGPGKKSPLRLIKAKLNQETIKSPREARFKINRKRPLLPSKNK